MDDKKLEWEKAFNRVQGKRRGEMRRTRTIASTAPVSDYIRKLSNMTNGDIVAAYEKDRVLKQVKPPSWIHLNSSQVFTIPNPNTPNNDQSTRASTESDTSSLSTEFLPNTMVLRDHFKDEGRLDTSCAMEIVEKAEELLMREPNIVKLDGEITIVGDIHGQYFDMLKLMEAAGDPETTPYLFLGDYVDRGCFSTEVCLYLFSLKIRFPNTIYLLRGNHECRLLTSKYNFKDECTHKYNEEVYEAFMKAFDAMPLAATVQNQLGTFLCLHGGLSPELDSMDQIAAIDRYTEVPREGPLCDLLWADPLDEWTAQGLPPDMLEEWLDVGFEPNPERGCSYVFGLKATKKFVEDNHLVSIIRAHEVQKEGYVCNFFLKQQEREHPYVITVFSAPNYCDMYRNTAAFMKLKQDKYTFEQVSWVQHPFYLPKFMDGFSYSLPFVIENLSKICEYIFSLEEGEEVDEEAEEKEMVELLARSKRKQREKKLNSLKNQVSMLKTSMRNLREINESLIKTNYVKETIQKFEDAITLDKQNDYSMPGSANNSANNNTVPDLRQSFYRRRSKTQ